MLLHKMSQIRRRF